MNEYDRREFFACLALYFSPGIGPCTWKSILSAYPNAYEAVHDVDNWNAKKLVRSNQTEPFKQEKWRSKAEDCYHRTMRKGMQVLYFHHPDYPEHLRQIPDPPACLYYNGDVSLLRNPGIGVVGARKCTVSGLRAAGRISYGLSCYGITVISGMAHGIDRQAHEAGLAGIGSSIAVLGTGLNEDYPRSNRDVRSKLENHGLLLTEFPPDTKGTAQNFPYRNRIISGLSFGVLVVEGELKSGSLITARYAAEQGRDVYAVPGAAESPHSAGCLKLLRDGAHVAVEAEDILNTLQYELQALVQEKPSARSGFDLDRNISCAVDAKNDRVQSGKGFVAAAQKSKSAKGLPNVPSGQNKDPKKVIFSPSVFSNKRDSQSHVDPELTIGSKAEPQKELDLSGFSTDQKQLLEVLQKEGRLHIDALGAALEWEAAQLSSSLVLLEVQGVVKQCAGMHYELA
ncbi:MAG: DNA-processing protein DprA [Desulfovibrio sp.]